MSDTAHAVLPVDLNGLTAIVTGASQGIGKSIAIAMAARGAKVAVVARNAAKLADTVAAIEAAGGVAEAYSCDVTKRESVEEVVDGVVEKWGKLDVLVNNAGVTRDNLLPVMTDDEWDNVIETNLRGMFLFTRAASKQMMRARFGRIINISSVSGLIGNPGQTNYSASKAGMIGFTRSLARELGKRKVTVNAVCPGFIESDMTKALGPAVMDEVKKRIPAQRMGKPEEIADGVLFLASPQAAYITGQILTIDGGMIG
ncbi:3-oxoacyl-[acyl-carrier-protein] reductase [Blastopirellula marina]|uniref:3-oxoacyl-[acyl-carrier-protein] reductase n=1 Tax=Blastopirellula marina TaxID=124 RepID=A0A2S8FWD1_9BACT|nr:3-oxoacyl-[acyl-carrier-protein] reductase [Blastopirellula marina]PQO36478.1 3-oxoacyl-[acyl-carrier-protein] reductase [Blastopirellula marina]PTL44315.1 3-oxoacyl-[acyl-carrier-protein] reductase [Blastopirellula marina]